MQLLDREGSRAPRRWITAQRSCDGSRPGRVRPCRPAPVATLTESAHRAVPDFGVLNDPAVKGDHRRDVGDSAKRMVNLPHLARPRPGPSSRVIIAVMDEDEREGISELALDEDLEAEPEIFPPSPGLEHRRVYTQTADPTIHGLHEDYQNGDLVLQPAFQRYFVWDRAKSSRLIESVLLNVPLPIVYLAQEPDGTSTVIDGQQRLTSFFEYIEGKFPLRGLRVATDLNGCLFKDLPKIHQKTLRQTAIRAITVLSESDPDLRYEIFERLNTGSVALNDQELRNCVFRGPYNELLKDLATDSTFMLLLGISHPEARMRDTELVLRFAAYFHSTYLKYQPPMRRFLNQDIERNRFAGPATCADLQQAFKGATKVVWSLLGTHAFKRYRRGVEGEPNGYWEPKRFNSSLYDILMWGFGRYPANQLFPHLDSIREGLIVLMTDDQEFIDSIELSTSSLKMVTTRFDKWRSTLDAIVGSPSHEPRCFSRDLKDELYERSPTCTLCGNRIEDIDDSAVDHVQQYWLGGRTIEANARLAHRYCNWSRSRSDNA